ncbi:hypothetical protein C8R44DRAFT_801837 [Mycena epipterygia]|nr:hypothetical protein C8R44DRAFT_801837 [Mycena epipterygia]
MPSTHLRRVRVHPSISPRSQPLFIHALSLHRPARRQEHTLRQSCFVRSFMFKKEGILYPRRQITAHVHALRTHKPAKSPRSFYPSPSAACATSISARRLGHSMPSVYGRLSSSAYPDPPVLHLKTPLPNLITPSRFPSPFTPVNQVLHTPFHAPEPHKGTPSKRHRNRQWSPALVPRLTSPGFDENTPPTHTPPTPDSPICNLTRRRLSLMAPQISFMHVPRRLSYSQACTSPWTPESSHTQVLASPVLIRSTLWTPSSPVASPRYLDDFHFSPFHVPTF